MNKLQLIISTIHKMVSDYAKIPDEELNDTDNLIEMGADSIVLSDVNAAIKGVFEVEIPITRYFEELTSIELIAEYLLNHVDEKFYCGRDISHEDRSKESVSAGNPDTIAVQPEESINICLESNLGALDGKSENGGSTLLRIIEKQLDLIKVSGSFNIIKYCDKETESEPIEKNETVAGKEPQVQAAEKEINQHNTYVPFKKLNMSHSEYTDEQKEVIQKLIARYTAVTKKSKEYVRKYRYPYADWRNIAGFKLEFKEMVYQLIFSGSHGAYITDLDGNEYIDLAMDFGVTLLGHNMEFINQEIVNEVSTGYPLSLVSPLAGEVAALIAKMVKLPRVAFFNSGTESVMTALRIARAYTGKNKIVIFAGSYHGTSDGVLGMPKYGSKEHEAIAIAIGIPANSIKDLVILDYDVEESLVFIEKNSESIAAVLTEPVQSRRPDLQPKEFLIKLREITFRKNVVLIFDEMILGFRIAKGGAQEYFGIQADLATYGKICGGGLPIGIVAGKEEIMNCFDGGDWNYGDDSVPPAENKRTFAGGTFSHHPLSMAAAMAVLTKIDNEADSIYPALNQKTKYMCDTLNDYFRENGVPIHMVYCGSLFRFVLKGKMELFYYFLLLKKVYVWEGRNCFLSMAHTDEDIDRVIRAVKESCMELKCFYSKESDRKKKSLISLNQIQKNMLFVDLKQTMADSLRETLLVKINGTVEEKELKLACEKVCRRHEALCYVVEEESLAFSYRETLEVPFEKIQDTGNIEALTRKLRDRQMDLKNGPLYHIYFITDESGKFSYFMIVAHHILLDGWSLSVLYQEIVKSYNNMISESNEKLLPVKSYSDYKKLVLEKNQQLDKWEIEEFAVKYVNHNISPVQLPYEKDVTNETALASRISVNKDLDFKSKVRKISSRTKTSPFMVYLAAFQILIGKIAGEMRFTIGVPVAGQQRFPEFSIVGSCMSICPVCVSMDKQSAISDLINQNKELLTAYNEMDGIELDSDIKRNKQPIKVLFNMDRIPRFEVFQHTEVEMVPLMIRDTSYDLFVNLSELSENLILDIDFTRKFSKERVVGWVETYFEIVDILEKNTNIRIIEIWQLLGETSEYASELKMCASELVKRLPLDWINDIGENICILIKDSYNNKVLDGSFGELYVGKSASGYAGTGYLARVTGQKEIEIAGRIADCVYREGYYYNMEKQRTCLMETGAVNDVKFTCQGGIVSAAIKLKISDSSIVKDTLNNQSNEFSLIHKIVLIDMEENVEEFEFESNCGDLTPTQMEIYNIISDIMKDKRIGLNTDLMNYGINSLTFMKILDRIQAKFEGVRVPIASIANAFCIGKIAEIIDGADGDEHSIIPLKKTEQRLQYEASSAQQRMYSMFKLYPGNTEYNVASYVQIHGKIDMVLLEDALRKCVQKHDVLRSTFKDTPDGVYYTIHDDAMVELEVCQAESAGEQEILVQEKRRFIKPFDLERGPLYRFKLVTVSDMFSILFVDIHHIIFDGISTNVFGKNLECFYNCREAGEISHDEFQYQDYTTWQKDFIETGYYKKQEKYWAEFYQEYDYSPLNLLYSRNHFENEQKTALTLNTFISDEESDNIHIFCIENKCTPFSYFVMCLNILLFKYTREENIAVGTVVAGRNNVSLQNLIGLFINTIPLNNRVSKELNIKKFVQEIEKNKLSAFENSDVPYEKIIQLSNTIRDGQRSPLFDVFFAYEDYDEGEICLGEAKARFKEVATETVRFDIEVKIVRNNNNYDVLVTYADELFSETKMQRFIQIFKNIICFAAKNQDMLVKDVNCVKSEELSKLQKLYDRTDIKYPMDETIVERFESAAHKYPDKIALIQNDESITYTELNQQANQLARYLRDAGVKRNDRIVLITHRNIRMVVAIYGILKAGAVYVPVDPMYPQERMNYMIDDSGAKFAVMDDTELEVPDEVKVVRLNDSAIFTKNKSDLDRVNQSDDPLYVIYTSGTTGKPKGTIVTHKNVVRLLFNEEQLYDFSENDVWTMFHSYGFDFSVWEMYGATLTGGKLVVVSRESAQDSFDYLDILESEKVTVLNQVPTSFYNLLQVDEMQNQDKMRNVRWLIFGGEALDLRKLGSFHRRYGQARIVNMYGITETTVHVTYKEIEDKEIERGISDIGTPIPTMGLVIQNDGVQCGVDMPGELCVYGAGVSKGYLNREDLTRQKFVSNPYGRGLLYRSGDLARWTDDGDIEYLGRIDSQLKLRGFRIEIGEIKNEIRSLSYINDAEVILLEKPQKALCAYVISEENDISARVKKDIGKKLPEYMIPTYIMKIDSFPLTGNGKLNSNKFPKPSLNIEKKGGDEQQCNLTGNEKVMIDVFKEILQVDNISLDSRFYELGGDSIKAIRIISKLHEQGFSIAMKHILSNYELREMALYLIVETFEYDQGEITGEVEETPIQKDFLQLGLFDRDYYNQSIMLESAVRFRSDAVNQVLNRLLEHHDMLRVKFENEKQIILKYDGSEKLMCRELSLEMIEDENILTKNIITECEDEYKGMCLADGKLFACILFHLPDRDCICFIAHHMIVDAVSWRILIEDFFSVYEALSQGKEVKMPQRTFSYQAWAAKINQFAKSEEFGEEQKFWNEMVNKLLQVNSLFTIESDELEKEHCEKEIEQEDSDLLFDNIGASYNVNIQDILVSALTNAVEETFGVSKYIVEMENNGRKALDKEYDVSRTVGWFTSTYHIVLEKQEGTEATLLHTKELLHSIPRGGLGYGIQKYINLVPEFLQVKSDISFNYLGEMNQSVMNNSQISSLSTGECSSEKNRLRSPLCIDVASYSGSFKIITEYNKAVIREDKMKKFLDNMALQVKRCINVCMNQKDIVVTASDLGVFDMSDDELDLLNNLI